MRSVKLLTGKGRRVKVTKTVFHQGSSTPVCTFNKKQTNKPTKPKTVEKIPTVLWLLAFVTFHT